MLIAGDTMNLKEYLFINRLTVNEFSKSLGYSRNHISGIISGRLKACRRLAMSIEKETNGVVKAEELFTSDESENHIGESTE